MKTKKVTFFQLNTGTTLVIPAGTVYETFVSPGLCLQGASAGELTAAYKAAINEIEECVIDMTIGLESRK